MRVERELFEVLLARRGVVGVVVDTSVDGVQLPEGLNGHVVLEFGLNMPIPITDMKSDDDALSGTLSFQRKPCKVVAPWSAILSLLPAAEDDSPQLAVTFLQPSLGQAAEQKPEQDPPTRPRGLRRVK
jgi:hypothetical protein